MFLSIDEKLTGAEHEARDLGRLGEEVSAKLANREVKSIAITG